MLDGDPPDDDAVNAVAPASARTRAMKSKTSVDILRERDALEAKLRDAVAALDAIRDEAEHALRNPEIAALAICRVVALLRRT